jgi:molybdate transport system substrate-binding protein
VRRAAFAVAIGLLLSSCGDTDGTRELAVFAASSLGAAFTELETVFEAQHDGVDVVLNLGPSDGLAAQIRSEGTADVFASASERWMDEVAEVPGLEDRTVVATNRLVIVTPLDDPAGIASIEDLADPGVQLVIGAEGVPVGDYARRALTDAGIAEAAVANVVSNEEDNASVVAKVAAGEADAGIVYVTDVSTATGNDLRAVGIPADVNVVATYPIAIVVGGDHADLARAFVDLVAGSEGQAILRRYGFGRPGG